MCVYYKVFDDAKSVTLTDESGTKIYKLSACDERAVQNVYFTRLISGNPDFD